MKQIIFGVTFAVVASLSAPLIASAPETSLRPAMRGEAVLQANYTRMRPQPRPVSQQVLLASASAAEGWGPDTSLMPFMRPKELEQKILFKKRKLRKTSVCGDISIQGEKVGDVPGKLNGCGTRDAVRVKSVAGVRLSQSAVMTCETAKSLEKWVSSGVKPAFKKLGRVEELQVAAHYACRTRNNRRGAKISEHGKGKAIDISGFTLHNGKTITVAGGWRSGQSRKALLRAWRSACGPFGTVLGPNADRYHQDHFHMDVARHRNGRYCR